MGLSAEQLLETVRGVLGERVLDQHAHCGDATIVIPREGAVDVFRTLRDHPDLRFQMLIDATAVDYLGPTPRFELVYHLYSLEKNHRLRVKIRVPEDDAWAESLVPLWKGANWLEREIWDMFGIRFRGHPDLRRILLYEEFEGHPLRKDYPVDRRHPLVPECDPIGAEVERS